ncbi:hypothetical protein NRB20_50180 [Nocardia sp. RB20]|uniref:Uncharacterized protein n=1 Tax=Nocardia macrotermitis TaxID=2585198 RepID=A0A7K0D7Z5_9NOCA|nr:hypothetical protein [Nocardia macrotermitis]
MRSPRLPGVVEPPGQSARTSLTTRSRGPARAAAAGRCESAVASSRRPRGMCAGGEPFDPIDPNAGIAISEITANVNYAYPGGNSCFSVEIFELRHSAGMQFGCGAGVFIVARSPCPTSSDCRMVAGTSVWQARSSKILPARRCSRPGSFPSRGRITPDALRSSPDSVTVYCVSGLTRHRWQLESITGCPRLSWLSPSERLAHSWLRGSDDADRALNLEQAGRDRGYRLGGHHANADVSAARANLPPSRRCPWRCGVGGLGHSTGSSGSGRRRRRFSGVSLFGLSACDTPSCLATRGIRVSLHRRELRESPSSGPV